MKRLTIILFLSLIALLSHAQGGATLVLWHADGTTTEVELNTMPKVEFHGDSVCFISSFLDMKYPKEDILRFSYKGVPSLFEMGDVNHDKNIDVVDVMLMVKYAMNKKPTIFYIQNADVNADGRYDVSDVMGIVRISLTKDAQASSGDIIKDEGLFFYSQGNTYMLEMEKASVFTAFQAEIVLPIGCNLTDVKLCKGCESSHQISYKDMGNGRFNLMVFSLDDKTFNNDGKLIQFNIEGTPTDEIIIDNILFTDSECKTTYFKSPQNTTIVDNMEVDSDEQPYYNLGGVKTKTPQRGVFIQNGKKKTVK